MYVGLATTPLNMWINNHKSSVTNQTNFKVSLHFNKFDHYENDMEIGILEHESNTQLKNLQILEAFWIYKLDTLNSGFNEKYE